MRSPEPIRCFILLRLNTTWREANDPHNEWIQVISKEVKALVAVRYCFKNFQIGNLGNMGQLPLIPFRTDNW